MERDPNIPRRIVITDYEHKGFIKYDLQEFKRKNFWSIKKSWVSASAGASHKNNPDGMVIYMIDLWKKNYPDAEVINTSQNYLDEMNIELDPFSPKPKKKTRLIKK